MLSNINTLHMYSIFIHREQRQVWCSGLMSEYQQAEVTHADLLPEVKLSLDVSVTIFN